MLLAPTAIWEDPNLSLATKEWLNEVYLAYTKLAVARETTLDSQATTSGTSDIEFTVPGCETIWIYFDSVRTNGTNPILIQLGSGTLQTTGYESGYGWVQSDATADSAVLTNGFGWRRGSTGDRIEGMALLSHAGDNTWCCIGTSSREGTTPTAALTTGGIVTLSGEIDTVGISPNGGTWNNGSIRVKHSNTLDLS